MLFNLFRKCMREQKIWQWCTINSDTSVNKHEHRNVFERQTATSFLTMGIQTYNRHKTSSLLQFLWQYPLTPLEIMLVKWEYT